MRVSEVAEVPTTHPLDGEPALKLTQSIKASS